MADRKFIVDKSAVDKMRHEMRWIGSGVLAITLHDDGRLSIDGNRVVFDPKHTIRQLELSASILADDVAAITGISTP